VNISLLIENILKKRSYLCVGLDTDLAKIPHFLKDSADPVFEFNKKIIDATLPYAVSYKLNTAFYEQYGKKGWESLEKTLAYIPKDCFTIADAKRGDIGNTSGMYAKAFFETLNFDAVTVAPYMGHDSLQPFLEYGDKVTIVLGLTSNKGAEDFQYLSADGMPMYEQVMRKVASWGTTENLMFVAGATKASLFSHIREILPQHFLLVPGVGSQGGSLEAVSAAGMIPSVGLLVNSSRAIIYASEGIDFAEKAGEEAAKMAAEMETILAYAKL
jgi:orotidine-5'-phosphate decarboxylase